MEQKFFICEHCTNIIAMIRDSGTPIYCCGEAMKRIIPKVAETSGEKHIPVYTVEGNTVTVTVGKVDHPMLDEHYIEWVCLETDNGVQYQLLKPGHTPTVQFLIRDTDSVKAVYAYCNQHSLWKQ